MTTKAIDETIDRLVAIRDEIKDLVREARDLVRGTIDGKAAEAYWIPHILGAFDADHAYLGGSMTTMQDTIDTLRGDTEGEDGDEESPAMTHQRDSGSATPDPTRLYANAALRAALEAARAEAEERAHTRVSPDDGYDAITAVNLYVEAFVAGARFQAERQR